MKKYFFRRHQANVTTSIECEQAFWSGIAVVFVKNNQTVAVIALMPGDVVIEEGAWKDLPAEALEPQTASKKTNVN